MLRYNWRRPRSPRLLQRVLQVVAAGVLAMMTVDGCYQLASRLTWLGPGALTTRPQLRPVGIVSLKPLRSQTTRSALGLGTAEAVVATVQHVALGLWEGYENLLETQSLPTDVTTAAVLNAASDSVAQISEMNSKSSSDGKRPGLVNLFRVLRFAIFGTMDGFFGHNWFSALDGAIPKTGVWLDDTLMKVAADSAIYTPWWCATFLVVMAILEGRGISVALSELRRDFFELIRGNYTLTLPGVCLIYGFVPVRFQVVGFAILTFCFTIVLSLWNNSRAHEEQNAASEPEPAPATELNFRTATPAVIGAAGGPVLMQVTEMSFQPGAAAEVNFQNGAPADINYQNGTDITFQSVAPSVVAVASAPPIAVEALPEKSGLATTTEAISHQEGEASLA